MKKICFAVCLFVCLFSVVFASDVKVQLNGRILDFTDSKGNKVEAQIINDRTMVPFRKIFNELGVSDDSINWDRATKTVNVKKDNLEIKLQIGNNIAEKSVNGVRTNIKLDSAPVIVEDRTLVPLRFIAESMGDTVGWNIDNKTAIIVDYNYFLEKIKSKSSGLYEFLMNDSKSCNFKITRKYTDLEDSNRNNTAIVSGLINEQKYEDNIKQIVSVNFDGNNELMQEIKTEGWNVIKFENTYYKDYFTTKALNDGLKNVYGQDMMRFQYGVLNCQGKYNNNIYETFKFFCSINENKINVSTFDERAQEFNNLLNKFKPVNAQEISTGNISSDSIEITYFDFTKFDNLSWDGSFNRVYNFLNSQLFKYDVTLEEFCYDYTNQSWKINADVDNLMIDFKGSNEYNERVEYIIEINKI